MKYVHSINESLEIMLKSHDEVILYGEDLLDPYGGAFKVTKGLSTKFPDRVLPTPISEAAIIGMAGGMAIGGLRPIVEIMFGDFIMLGADQLLNHLVKYEWMYNEKVKVPVTIRATMGGRRGYGPTHSQSLESILCSIPGLKIISPTHYHNPGELLEHTTINEPGIKIFCEYKLNYPKELLNKSNCQDGISVNYSNGIYPTVYLSNSEFDDPEVLIISHGGNSILIEQLLMDVLIEYELSIQANFPSLIKPLPFDELFDGIENCKMIIIIEESPKNFGWGNEIVAFMAENGLTDGKSIARIGAAESPIPSSRLLENKALPNKNDIIDKIKSTGIIL
jgi:pyruvate/2-oxoglutarate/acetoin dehydrogenase E1 component